MGEEGILWEIENQFFMKRHNFKKLKVWQDAMLLVKDIYDATRAFPKEELFSLTQQIRRSAM